MEIDFDNVINITTVQTFIKFKINNITLTFGQDAVVDVFMYDTTGYFRNENIPISNSLYTSWAYDETMIIDYCKNYIQTKYSTGL
jgi:hypothetical protein